MCGLVILELFKLVLRKDTDAYMNRQIALAVNRYTSYTQEKPVSYETKTEITPPSETDYVHHDKNFIVSYKTIK